MAGAVASGAALTAVLGSLEASSVGLWVREGPWTYGLVNTTHVLGVAALFGAVAVLDLRLMGLWRDVPTAVLAGPCTRVAGAGLAVALFSGVLLLTAQATEYQYNPVFWIKLGAVALAVTNLALLHRSSAWKARAERAPGRRLAWAGGMSIALWAASISAGRLIAYW